MERSKALLAEQQHLDGVLADIRRRIHNAGEEVEHARQEIYAQRIFLWDNYYENDRERAHDEVALGRSMNAVSIRMEHARKLLKLRKQPYFARVDFKAEGETQYEALYIGPAGLQDEETFEVKIYDWRSPIASIYYEYERGPVQYRCPDGIIRGDVSLKRQLDIENGVIQGMFDTAVTIDDGLLKELLSEGASQRMHEIISTIQRSQNRIIRHEAPVLIVSGVAGSGKTSVALHRIAYLLYLQREKLAASQVTILSPNALFSDYICEVLPELGEQSVWQTTFGALAQGALPGAFHQQTFADFLEELFDEAVAPQRVQIAARKAQESFADELYRFFSAHSDCAPDFIDAKLAGTCIVSADEMQNIYESAADHLSVQERMARIEALLLERLEERRQAWIQDRADALEDGAQPGEYFFRAEAEAEAKQLWQREMQDCVGRFRAQNDPDVFSYYMQFLATRRAGLPKSAAKRFAACVARRSLDYEDIAALVYLCVMMGSLKPVYAMRHVVVDEAQDYSVLHWRALKLLYPRAHFTILGDPQQALDPHLADLHKEQDGFAAIVRVFAPQGEEKGESGGIRRIHMENTYRLTAPVCAYANTLGSGAALVDAVGRQGEAVAQENFSDLMECARALQTFFLSSCPGAMKAIITRTLREAIMLRDAFGSLQTEIQLMTGDERQELTREAVMILPVYLAKGLEFDDVAVLCTRRADEAFCYVGATRAMARLMIAHVQ